MRKVWWLIAAVNITVTFSSVPESIWTQRLAHVFIAMLCANMAMYSR